MNLDRTLFYVLGHGMLAASRALARHGARLIGHPSAQPEPRPLRVVRTETVRTVEVDPVVERLARMDPRDAG